MNCYQVTRFVTFRRSGTQASPCSSVWQNGDAGLAMLSQRAADRTSSSFIADGRLKAVDAAGGCDGGYDMLLKPLKVCGVSGRQEAPLVVGACLGAEGA